MNAHADPVQEAGHRPIDQWFAHYSADHRNAANQWIHVFAVPLILWSVIGPMWLGLLVAVMIGFAAWVRFGYRAPAI